MDVKKWYEYTWKFVNSLRRCSKYFLRNQIWMLQSLDPLTNTQIKWEINTEKSKHWTESKNFGILVLIFRLLVRYGMNFLFFDISNRFSICNICVNRYFWLPKYIILNKECTRLKTLCESFQTFPFPLFYVSLHFTVSLFFNFEFWLGKLSFCRPWHYSHFDDKYRAFTRQS